MRSITSIRNAKRVNSWKKRQFFYLTTEKITYKHIQLWQNHNIQTKFMNLKQRLITQKAKKKKKANNTKK